MRLATRCLLLLVLSVPATLPAQTVRGRVIDANTRQPVATASVSLVDGDRAVVTVSSDSSGRFLLSAPRGGRYRISATRLGFADAMSNYLELISGEAVNAELQMSSEAVKIAPLTLETPRDRYLESKGFYERVQAGTGDFMNAETVRRRNSYFLADLLRGMRGIKIQRVNMRNEVYFTGANCFPMIVLDGVTVRWGGKQVPGNTATALEDLVPVGHIDGIEAYRGGSGAPTEYIGPNAACGVILIWTRHN